MLTILSSLPGSALERALVARLEARNLDHVLHDLRHERFAPCQGCFQCWVESPGVCKAKDAGNEVMRDIVRAEGVIWVTEPRFGSWDPICKAALDKSIGLISPFFKLIDGETHHHARYDRYARWAVLAKADRMSAEQRAAFAHMVERNTLNMHSAGPMVLCSDEPGDIDVDAVIDDVRREATETHASSRAPAPAPPREGARGVSPGDGRPRHAVLWVGSAKPSGTSSSESLGRGLLEELERRGWTTEVVWSARVTRLNRQGSPKLIEAARRSDLLVLSAPVYVDSLPALVLEGLGELVDAASEEALETTMLPIIQCGFPETSHTRLAVDVVADAAGQAGIGWAGHLAMGCGGFIDGASLSAQARFEPLRRALDEVASALDGGEPVPPRVTERLAEPALNPMLYRWMGQVGWLASAFKNKSVWALWDKPFPADDAASL